VILITFNQRLVYPENEIHMPQRDTKNKENVFTRSGSDEAISV